MQMCAGTKERGLTLCLGPLRPQARPKASLADPDLRQSPNGPRIPLTLHPTKVSWLLTRRQRSGGRPAAVGGL